MPGATWPNRNMAHAGTADDTVDNEIRLYGNETVFERLKRPGAAGASTATRGRSRR